MNEGGFENVPGHNNLLSLGKGENLKYYQRYFVPEIITDDNGIDVEHPTLGQYYLEEMTIETETHFEVLESYHTTSSYSSPDDETPVIKRVPREEQSFWAGHKVRMFDYRLKKIIAEQTSAEPNFIPGSERIYGIEFTLNPDSAEDFNDQFADALWKEYPEAEIGTQDFFDDENQAYMATFLYEYKVFRPKIP